VQFYWRVHRISLLLNGTFILLAPARAAAAGARERPTDSRRAIKAPSWAGESSRKSPRALHSDDLIKLGARLRPFRLGPSDIAGERLECINHRGGAVIKLFVCLWFIEKSRLERRAFHHALMHRPKSKYLRPMSDQIHWVRLILGMAGASPGCKQRAWVLNQTMGADRDMLPISASMGF